MGQSATLYRIANSTFVQSENPDIDVSFYISSAKSDATFEGSFMGIEYVLSKGLHHSDKELLSEIFNPTKLIGGEDVESLPIEEQFELYENGGIIPYLDPFTISKINRLLSEMSEAAVDLNYNAKELNKNGIYPEVWHDDNSADQAFNKRHLSEDFIELKTIISQAHQEQDYIIVFVG